jgi:hypothetical protein
MLNEIGVATALHLRTTADLFGSHRHYLHTTSALRYPVFVDDKNYTGHSPKPFSNDYLRSMVETLLADELVKVGTALVVPLGKAAEACVVHALSLCGAQVTVLHGFPHPSGANGHRVRLFDENKKGLRAGVRKWSRFA